MNKLYSVTVKCSFKKGGKFRFVLTVCGVKMVWRQEKLDKETPDDEILNLGRGDWMGEGGVEANSQVSALGNWEDDGAIY